MDEFTSDDVNAVLRFVSTLAPGDAPMTGEVRLSMLAMALCVSARAYGVERERFLDGLDREFLRVQQLKLRPLAEIGVN